MVTCEQPPLDYAVHSVTSKIVQCQHGAFCLEQKTIRDCQENCVFQPALIVTAVCFLLTNLTLKKQNSIQIRKYFGVNYKQFGCEIYFCNV